MITASIREYAGYLDEVQGVYNVSNSNAAEYISNLITDSGLNTVERSLTYKAVRQNIVENFLILSFFSKRFSDDRQMLKCKA